MWKITTELHGRHDKMLWLQFVHAWLSAMENQIIILIIEYCTCVDCQLCVHVSILNNITEYVNLVNGLEFNSVKSISLVINMTMSITSQNQNVLDEIRNTARGSQSHVLVHMYSQQDM